MALIVPETRAARLSMIISLPSEAMSFTGVIEDWARCDASAARTWACIAGIGASMLPRAPTEPTKERSGSA